MKKYILYISILSIFVVASLAFLFQKTYALFESNQESELTSDGNAIVMKVTKEYTPEKATYTAISKFPIDGYVLNLSNDYFCIQHDVAWGGKHLGNTIGSSYHKSYTVTKNKFNYVYGSSYSDKMDADLDTSADYYATTSLITTNAASKTYTGYKESNESPSETEVYTNWYYTSSETSFNCEEEGNYASEKSALAFLFACYKAGSTNNLYVRGSYTSDPLQTAVWAATWLNSGDTEDNKLKYQGEQYNKYHEESDEPNVDVIPATDVGTILSGSTYIVGPFTMSKYVRAADYDCPRVDASGNAVTGTKLQDIFGTDDDLRGDIIKVEAILTNSTGKLSDPIDITNKIYDTSGNQTKISPELTFNIHFSDTEIDGYDELVDIVFTYQRVHASANGTKYIGYQYEISWSEKSSVAGCTEYKCSGCSCALHSESWCHNCNCRRT